jgi:glycosyltransferase involved in cell wall biosynthesis
MKILIVQTFHYFRGGDCTYGFSLANLLKKKGHQINYFGMKHPLNLLCEDEKYFVDYIDFREANANKNIINGLKVVSRSIYSIQARAKFRKILNDKNPDIIHLQNLHGHLTPSILYEAKKNKIPVVMTLHDYKFICPNTHFLSHGIICEKCKGSKYYNCTLNKCKKESIPASIIASLEAYIHKLQAITYKIDLFISPSNFLKNKFVEYGYDSSKVKVINNFLSDNIFSYDKEDTSEYIVYFGQLEIWKGVQNLIAAAKELPGIQFKIIGEGSYKDKLTSIANSLNVKNITFEGFKGKIELFKIIKQSKLIIVPSEWYENYPYSIMEAMAQGKPVIASNIGGLPELVTHQETGLLFKAGNKNDLIMQIKKLYYNNNLLKTYSENAYEFAKKNWNDEKYYSNIIYEYNKLIN